jgi:4-methylaminobutanoate oxidase (formaldehyde-forming)
MIERRPTLDLWEVDPRRFPPFANNLKALSERIPETLGIHYLVAYPGREPATARGVRRTAFHDRLAAKGAEFGTRAGWERPLWFHPRGERIPIRLTFGRPPWFDAVAREHRAARENVAVVDQSTFGKLLVQGAGAESLLQRLCANDVGVPAGRVVYTGLLNELGGFESDLTAHRLAEDSFLLVTGTQQAVRDRDWIGRHLSAGDRVAVTDVTSAYAVLGVAGPRARALLARVSPADFSNAGFPYYTSREIEIGYALARAARVSYTGELGFELYVACEFAAHVYDALQEAGADLGLRDIGIDALTSLRIEKGYRAWGHELTPEDTPLEAGLGFAVKLKTQIPFVGRDALLRQRDEGVKRRLVLFTLEDGSAHPFGREAIVYGDEIVGQVTSAAFGHTVGRAVAMGYVRGDARHFDEMLRKGGFAIEIACERFPAKASLEPPYDPKGLRARG